ncbi:MAG: hypothetical protein JO189_12985, partial [Deltaproteobacteria bacterium]|nr:hypothetical protein [Deltaproteobacteria bacterium]
VSVGTELRGRIRLGLLKQDFFAIGIIGVDFLAVPVMSTGAAYDLCQSIGWEKYTWMVHTAAIFAATAGPVLSRIFELARFCKVFSIQLSFISALTCKA